MRSHPLPLLAALAGLVLAAAAPAQQPIGTQEVLTGVNSPVFVDVPPGDDGSRIFVITQFGKIRIVKDGVLLTTAFLDINSKLRFSGEQGLLGLAFHPNYAQNGYFYVNYTDNTGGDTVIERYSVDPGNPDLALANSGLVLLEIDQPFSNHNGGWIEFGPDGYLYVATGDGGDANDPGNRGQRGDTLLGKMLRLDVDNPAPGLNYGIPPTNPFVSDPNVLDEIWALGLRNPWRNDFDDETGDLWIADVGQNTWEEVNFAAAGTAGLNYGWKIMEGNHCFSPSSGCNQTGLTLPIHEYSHGGAPFRCSVTGGVVYRGREMADMRGRYFFADYCSAQVWSLRYVNGAVVDFTEHTIELAPPTGSLSSLVSFGEDLDGEMYLCSQAGTVWKIVPTGLRLTVPQLAAGSATTLEVSNGTPNALSGVFYSLSGLGSTPLPPANVTLGIANGTLIATRSTDASGVAQFPGTVPVGLQDRTVWLQAAQLNKKSNVVVERVD